MPTIADEIGSELARILGQPNESQELSVVAREAIASTATARRVEVSELEGPLRGWLDQVRAGRLTFSDRDTAFASMRQAANKQNGSGAFKQALRWAVTHPTQSLPLAGILLTGILRLSYERFYAPLGLSPEEAGFGSTEILARSVLGALAWVLIGALVGFAVMLPYIALIGPTLRRRFGEEEQGQARLVVRRPSRGELAGFAALLGVAFFVAWLLFESWLIGASYLIPALLLGCMQMMAEKLRRILGGLFFSIGLAMMIGSQVWIFWSLTAAVFVASGILVAAGTLFYFMTRKETDESPETEERPFLSSDGRDYGYAFAFVAFLMFTLLLTGLPLTAGDLANDVKDGKPVEPLTLRRIPVLRDLPVLSLSARPAKVFWRQGQRPEKLDLGGCILYLGRSGGTLVLYQFARPSDALGGPASEAGSSSRVRERRLLRLNANDVTLAIGESCSPTARG